MDKLTITFDLEKLSLEEIKFLKKMVVEQLLFESAARLRHYEKELLTKNKYNDR